MRTLLLPLVLAVASACRSGQASSEDAPAPLSQVAQVENVKDSRAQVITDGALASATLPVPTSVALKHDAERSSSQSLSAEDIQGIVRVVVDRILAPTTLTEQRSVPLKVDGYAGELPDSVLGKPVFRVDDVDSFLDSHYKADDIDANNVLSLRILEQKGEGIRISVFQSRGWGGLTRAELWISHAGTSWSLDSIVSRQEIL